MVGVGTGRGYTGGMRSIVLSLLLAACSTQSTAEPDAPGPCETVGSNTEACPSSTEVTCLVGEPPPNADCRTTGSDENPVTYCCQ